MKLLEVGEKICHPELTTDVYMDENIHVCIQHMATMSNLPSEKRHKSKQNEGNIACLRAVYRFGVQFVSLMLTFFMGTLCMYVYMYCTTFCKCPRVLIQRHSIRKCHYVLIIAYRVVIHLHRKYLRAIIHLRMCGRRHTTRALPHTAESTQTTPLLLREGTTDKITCA